jgi:hypothetical protein
VRIDMVGKRFGRLVGVCYAGVDAGKSGRAARWMFQCDCGNEHEADGHSVRSGNTSSCGCLSRDTAIALHTEHGMCESPTYYSWGTMIQRCTNPTNTNFKHYGARGITVCERWMSFENFLADMGERPIGLTLERKENDLGYTPSNCKWATKLEQANNTRLRHDNITGVKGVRFVTNQSIGRTQFRVDARVRAGNKPKVLYYGNDLFEAFCARKSWEANHKEF